MDKKYLIDKIAEITSKVGDLEQELIDLEGDLDSIEADEDLYSEDDDQWIYAPNPDPEFLETLDPYIFLREIGLDPFNLPDNLGELMAIRDAVKAARMLR